MKTERQSERAGGGAVSNEEIIAALMQSGTIAEAAEKVGLTPRSVYERMKTREFIAAYSEAKNDLVRAAVFSINRNLGAAIDTVTEIMTDNSAPASVRLQAAQTIITHAAKFADRLRIDEYNARTAAEDPFAAN